MHTVNTVVAAVLAAVLLSTALAHAGGNGISFSPGQVGRSTEPAQGGGATPELHPFTRGGPSTDRVSGPPAGSGNGGNGHGLDPAAYFSQTVIDHQPHLHVKAPISCSTLWWHFEHPTDLLVENDSDTPVPPGTKITMTVMPSGQQVVFTLWEGLAPGQSFWLKDVITGDYTGDKDCDVIMS